MKNFAQEKNGYNKKDVDLYIINIEKELEEAKAKIKSLNEQIFSLSENLEYYKGKENIINKKNYGKNYLIKKMEQHDRFHQSR